MTEKRSLNVIVMGDMGVGKSSLLTRFTRNTFKTNNHCTTLVDHFQAKMNINNENVVLSLWDTSGNETYRKLFNVYLRQAEGVLLVYDVTSPLTFAALPRWLSLLRAVNETAHVIIVGNKTDKEYSKERVAAETVKEFADELKLDFMEASAKTAVNVEKVFRSITQKILSSGIKNLEEEEDDSKITLSEGESMQKPKKKCCSLF